MEKLVRLFQASLAGFFVVLLMAASKTARADDFFICVPNNMQMKLSLVVKPSVLNAKEIGFTYRGHDPNIYRVTEINDLIIRAKEENADPPETAYSLEIKRVTGEMEVVTRTSFEAVNLLRKICEGEVPQTQCVERMEKIKGASWSNCFNALDRCSNWKEGNNFISRNVMQCSKVERQF